MIALVGLATPRLQQSQKEAVDASAGLASSPEASACGFASWQKSQDRQDALEESSNLE